MDLLRLYMFVAENDRNEVEQGFVLAESEDLAYRYLHPRRVRHVILMPPEAQAQAKAMGGTG